ncbi:hypothetical protein [Streptomyces hesseae]|uniref:Uncharacterized protein n=1 Tax=Streptomyces hesseae TaxID=3075519 RepID=A0ABU2T0F0_9ACTN|nr:hypothetical protein [Streptomyces sp. DSM 40473]MDT0453755.1 hypothetical protein [Streptomyces sp. DSM 40473]
MSGRHVDEPIDDRDPVRKVLLLLAGALIAPVAILFHGHAGTVLSGDGASARPVVAMPDVNPEE